MTFIVFTINAGYAFADETNLLQTCRKHVFHKSSSAVVMRGIPIPEIYRGIKYHGIAYRVLVKYRGIMSGGIDEQYTFHQA